MILEQLKYQIDVDFTGLKSGVQRVKSETTQLSTILDRANRSTKKTTSESRKAVESFGTSSVASFKKIAIASAAFLGIGLTVEAFRRGLVSATNSMVDLGIKSSFLGMGAKNLDGFNKGYAALGSTAEKAQSALMELQGVLVWKNKPIGNQPGSYQVLEELSTLTGQTITDAKSAEEALFGLSNAIYKLNDLDAMSYRMRLGGMLDEATFLSMRDGTFNDTIKSRQASSTYTEEDVKRSRQIALVMAKLEQSADNLRNSFFMAFGDDIASALNTLSEWLIENKDGIIGFFRDLKEIAVALVKAFGDVATLFSANKSVSQTTFAQKINQIPAGARGYLQHPLLRDYSNGTLTQQQIDDYNKKFDKETRNYFNNHYVKDAERDAVSKAIDKDYVAPSSSGVSIGSNGRYVPSFKPKDGEVVKDGSGGKYYATTDEYKDANGNIVNPVRTDVGLQSMDRILDAIAYRESRGDPNAKNPHSSATGMFQFTTATAKHWGLRVDDQVDERLDPVKSRAAAERYFRFLLKQYNGNVADAMAAYGGGATGLKNFINTGKGINQETIDSVYGISKYLNNMNIQGSQFHKRASQTTNSTNINTVNINNPVGNLSQMDNQINLTKTNMAWG